jgi:hypothetical protein
MDARWDEIARDDRSVTLTTTLVHAVVVEELVTNTADVSYGTIPSKVYGK